MRTSLVCLVFVSLLTVGCQLPNENGLANSQAIANTVNSKGLSVSIRLPKRSWKTGETMAIEIQAVNTSGSPVEICSPTGAPVFVRIMKRSKTSYEQVHVYPGSATANILNWTLPARDTRTFKLMVPIEPDWPVAEMLYVSAELNGYPKYNPSLAVIVQPGDVGQ